MPAQVLSQPLTRQPPRVLFLAMDWRPLGGLEIYNLYLARALQAAGCRVEAWGVSDQNTVAQDGVIALPLAPPTRLGSSLYGRFLWNGLLRWRLRRALVRFDLLVVGHVYLLPCVFSVLQEHPDCSIPYWVWTYGIEVWRELPRAISDGLRCAQRIGSISHFTADKIAYSLPGATPIVIHNPIDVDKFKPAKDQNLSPPTRPKRLLTVGRLSSQERYKGHEIVMQALSLLKQRLGEPVEYHIIGDGDDLPRLKDYATNLGLQEAVRFLGRVSDTELVRAYQDCDVFVMPSRVERRPDGTWEGEGFGFVYIEAAACGKPVIASNQGGAQEAVVDGVTGFAVDPASPEAVAEAACRLLFDQTLARRMGEAGRQLVVRDFSVNVFQSRVTQLLRECGF